MIHGVGCATSLVFFLLSSAPSRVELLAPPNAPEAQDRGTSNFGGFSSPPTLINEQQPHFCTAALLTRFVTPATNYRTPA